MARSRYEDCLERLSSSMLFRSLLCIARLRREVEDSLAQLTGHSAVAVRAASGRHRRPRRKQAICCNAGFGCVWVWTSTIRDRDPLESRKSC